MIVASHVPMPWGNVDTDVFAAWGQWAGGIGSLAAVLAALWIAIADTRRRDHEQRDQQAANARTVTTRCEWTTQDSGLYERNLVLHVTNHGPRPVLDVHLENAEARVDGKVHRVGSPRKPVRLTDVIGPGADHVGTSLLFNDLPDQADDYVLTITFMDADGLYWRRVGKQQPTRVLKH